MISVSGFDSLESIYQGTSTVVYRARRQSDNCSVILRLPGSEIVSPQLRIRYRNEFSILQSVDSPYVIQAYDLHDQDYSPVLILEDFAADSLAHIMQTRDFSPAEIIQIGIQLSQALNDIHSIDIIHRDLKPSNILFNETTGEIKLIDFALATLQSPDFLPNNQIDTHDVGSFEGTLRYISPEQTGRINRVVDYRTDFYSLGITLYELLTGSPPFVTEDSLELVHNHIAKQVPSLDTDRHRIPDRLAAIVRKLLEKLAEDRYQNAQAIALDLQACTSALDSDESDDTTGFELAKNDIPNHLNLTQKLFGRESERSQLLEHFNAVSTGESRVIFLTGEAGIGKSSLVRELQKPVTQHRGYFITATYNPLGLDAPYLAFTTIIRRLIRHLLSESDLDKTRDQLILSLQGNGQILIDLLPDVEKIIGEQPDVPELPSEDASNRLALTFSRLLTTICSVDRPLVIFLDDLQTVDISSIELLETILFSHKIPYLFAIGALISGSFEVDDPRRKTLLRIVEMHPETQRVDLHPLTKQATSDLISDSLFLSNEEVQPLATVTHHKTGGNPYFIHEFLRSLYADGCLFFDPRKGNWHWDLQSVENQDIAENVGEFLADKIKTLNPGTLKSLKYASCFPNKFTLPALSELIDHSNQDTLEFLQPAVDEGYLIHLATDTSSSSAQNEFQFSHSRVRQTAYALLSPEEKRSLHETIGNNLLSEDSIDQDSSIFDIVNQLNTNFEAARYDEQESDRLANLNLKAGQRAKEAAAYQPAFKYFRTALALCSSLPNSRYETVLQLYMEAAESAFLCGDAEQMQTLIRSALEHANNDLDKARIHEISLHAQISSNRNTEAIKTGRLALRLLGINLPVQGQMMYTFTLFSSLLLSPSYSLGKELSHTRKMQRPELLVAMRILMQLCQVGYITGTRDVAMYILKMRQLSNKYGMAPESSFAYPLFGSLLISHLGKIDAGYHIGQMAYRNIENQGMELQCKTITLVNNFILFWKQHLRDSLEPLARAAQIGAESGDVEFSLVATMSSCTNVFLLGYELSNLERKLSTHNLTASELNQTPMLSLGSIYQQAVLNLIETRDKPWILDGDVYNEGLSLPFHQEIADATTIANLFTVKLSIAVLFGEFEAAYVYAREARERLQSIIYTPLGAFFYFYESLTLLHYVHHAARLPWWQRSMLLSRVKRNQRAMKKWAQHAPMNVAHKYELVEAEKCNLSNQHSAALDHYDNAMALARKNGYLNEEGLANELTGRFYARTGKQELSHYYLRRAKSCYTRWGAFTKVQTMDIEFRSLDGTQTESSRTDFTEFSASLKKSQSDTFSTFGSVLDLGSVVKASQALSGELVLDEVLKQLMQVVLENAAAHKASLILSTPNSLSQEITTLMDEPEPVHQLASTRLEDSDDLPISVIQYVARTGEDLVLNDVSEEDIFTQDPYILTNKPKSILCIPVIHQTQLTGILYLENKQSIDAFSSDRLAVLKLLASQSAIAIENAKLYRQLDDSRDRYLSLYQNALQGIFEGDSNGALLNTNPAAARLLGYDSPDELLATINKPGVLLFEQSESASEFYQRLLEDGLVVGFETQLARKDHSEIWVSMSAQTILDEHGNVELVEGSIIDITERKRREDAEQARLRAEAATETKSEFLAKMSHEIRTPMNAILGYTDLALDTRLTRQQIVYLETIQNSSHHLLRVVNDILDISKIEAGKLELQKQPFSLENTFKELSDLFALEASEKHLKLVFPEPTKNDPMNLHGDAARIEQILINLIGNSIKFTYEGKIEILLSIEELATRQVKLNFSVIDTGIGIEESQLDIIFDSFSQAHSPVHGLGHNSLTEHTGTGLGLSISNHLVALMGGSIDVSSTPGVGSRFDFSILVDHVDAQLTRQDARPGGKHKDWSLLRDIPILLVEDNLINQELAREVLENAGMKVTLAQDGQEALNRIEKHDFAAILMDVRMPRMDGYEATKIIRQNSDYDHIPIIAISAGVLRHEIEKALDLGFNDFVSKPVAFDRLFDLLVEMIDSRFQVSGVSIETHDTKHKEFRDSSIKIPELDVTQALKNHNGNSLLFTNLLGDFVHYYQDAPLKLQEYISAGDLESAERLAHNVAGVAGSFAAKDLMIASREFEHAITTDSPEHWQPLLRQFEGHINSLIASIKRFEKDVSKLH